MSDPLDPRHAAAPAPRSHRGQSLVEFALLLPLLIVLFLGIADFGRVFAAGITLEAAARNAAEIVAQEYLRNPPEGDFDTGPAPTPGDDDYYRGLHELAARTACRELRGLAGVSYTPDDTATPASEEACGAMPLIRTCIHDEADTRCGAIAFGHAAPDTCPALRADMNNNMDNMDAGEGTEQSRYVEVRICYEFNTIVNFDDVQLPLNFGISVGELWLEKDRVFNVGFYPPPPTPTPPPPPPPPSPTTAPCSVPLPSFTFAPPDGVSPLGVQFTDTSQEVDCAIDSWTWDFGDGSQNSTLQNPTHTFVVGEDDPPTTFTITLTVSSGAGSASATQTITVDPAASACAGPSAGFIGEPGSGSSPLEVQFTDESLDNGCEITSWTWEFGDGTDPSTEQNPLHVFENNTGEPVTYQITLTVVNDGDSSVATAEITVDPAQ